MAAPADPLARYRTKRDFRRTPEPAGELGGTGAALAFVVQKHAATRLPYDFRLELGGVMLSWAATFSAVIPMWMRWNGSCSTPSV